MSDSEQTVQAWVEQLMRARAGSDTPRLDTELLLIHAGCASRTWLIANAYSCLPETIVTQLKTYLAAFSDGVPMAYITGQQEFWSLPLAVNAATLIPRPDTECLVEWVLQQSMPNNAAVLDLGTGSGAIALALKSERSGWHLAATDRSVAALAMAEKNATSLQLDVEFLLGDWLQPVKERCFDCIISNPPYIAEKDPHLQALSHEPMAALTAGEDGLHDLSAIVVGVYDRLNAGGWLVLEHGYDQQAAVMGLLRAAGLQGVSGHQDLSGQDRFVTGRKSKS